MRERKCICVECIGDCGEPDNRPKSKKIATMYEFLSENSRSEHMENFIEGYYSMEEQLFALREKCAELEKDLQVIKGQYHGACDIIKELEGNEITIAELQRQLDETAKQDPVGEVMTKPFGSDNKDLCVLQWKGDYRPKQGDKLYRYPPNLTDIIEQAKSEEREKICQMTGLHLSERQRNAIRLRKP